MIIQPLDVGFKHSESQPAQLAQPPYNRASLPPADLRPTNYLCISRSWSQVSGSYLINPSLNVPDFLLPPIKKGEERRNLKLSCIYGTVSADVWLVSDNFGVIKDELMQRAALEFEVHAGTADVKVRRSSTYPVNINVVTILGTTTIGIPRSFCGPVRTASWLSEIKVSPGIRTNITMYSDVKGEGCAFLGNLTRESLSDASWSGDELKIVTTVASVVKVMFEDELQENIQWSGLFAH